MSVASYVKQVPIDYTRSSATSPQVWSFTFDASETSGVDLFRALSSALDDDLGTPSPLIHTSVGYTAYTLDADGEYSAIEVGSGDFHDDTIIATSPSGHILYRTNISFSTNSNSWVDFGASATIYVTVTLNAADLII